MRKVLLIILSISGQVLAVILGGYCPAKVASPKRALYYPLDKISPHIHTLYYVLYHLPAEDKCLNPFTNPYKDLGQTRFVITGLTVDLLTTMEYYFQLDLLCKGDRDFYNHCPYFEIRRKSDDFFTINISTGDFAVCPMAWTDINLLVDNEKKVILLWGCNSNNNSSYDLGAWILSLEEKFYRDLHDESILLSFAKHLNVSAEFFVKNTSPRSNCRTMSCDFFTDCMNCINTRSIMSGKEIIFFFGAVGCVTASVLVTFLALSMKNIVISSLGKCFNK